MNTEKSEESKAETGAEEARIKDSSVSSESAHSPKEDYQTLYIRAMADLENFRKRVSKDKQEIIKMANASLFEALLPIIDNMKLGLEAAKNQKVLKWFCSNLKQFWRKTDSRKSNQKIIFLTQTFMKVFLINRLKQLQKIMS